MSNSMNWIQYVLLYCTSSTSDPLKGNSRRSTEELIQYAAIMMKSTISNVPFGRERQNEMFLRSAEPLDK
jgi:hypothetical protein